MTAEGRIERHEGVLRLLGEVDATSVLELRKQGEQFIQQAGQQPLIIDLSGLSTAHTVVLSLLLCWHRLALSLQGQLSFTGASDRLVSLAALSSLQNQLPGFSPQS
ncbi:NTP-binding protein [Marinobacter fuscus]|uniref:NTP-binding protein n=1 Tax=Marinobacter fuscus TaxID=2109942 RepID=A0A2T1K726_9GAMM|nr:STAS domain-containing protein [Marinobacter fuscus]PSF05956.1 NTP-binding protein [Marinobacter fuscus]